MDAAEFERTDAKYDPMRTGMEAMYGFFCGGDPRLFRPDLDGCSVAEVDNWKAACDEWDLRDAAAIPRIDGGEAAACIHGPDFSVLVARFGIGTQWCDPEELED